MAKDHEATMVERMDAAASAARSITKFCSSISHDIIFPSAQYIHLEEFYGHHGSGVQAL
jgi:hypothetical protein